MPHAPAPPLARTSAALTAVAAARPGASLVALILALLLRILARTEAAWLFPEHDDADEYEEDYAFDAYAICGANPYALIPRPVGRAPHAACIEAGLVPDWILPGIRNRGMRALPRATPPRHHTLPARAPPPSCRTPRAEIPSNPGAPTHALFHSIIKSIIPPRITAAAATAAAHCRYSRHADASPPAPAAAAPAG